MKILLFRTDPSVMNIKNYNSQEIGLAKAYTRLGHQCDIVYYNGKNESRVEEIDAGEGKTIRIFWMHGFSFLNNGFFPGITRLVREYDVIQVSEYYFWGSWYIYRKFAKEKKVYIYQGVYDSSNSRKFNLRCRLMDPFMLTKRVRATKVFTKSRLAEEAMRRRGFTDLTTVGVGLDTARLHDDTPPSDWTQDVLAQLGEDPCLLYIGVLEDRRNTHFLVDVMRLVTEKRPTARLLVVGRGEDAYVSGFLDKVREAGLESHIIYKDGLPQGELQHLYRRAKMFLLPTKYEIFGMVIMEAMSFGVPVITTCNGGSATVMQDGVNGRILDTLTPDVWAEAVGRLLEDEEARVRMSTAALETGAERFSWDAIAATMETYFKEE